MKLAYFVHDLADPAVARRVRMLQAGGADPLVLGFRRRAEAPRLVEGAPAVDLGRTYDARLAHRAAATLASALSAGALRDRLAGAEIFMARTLEMLSIAEAARRAARRAARMPARLIYECLDIHRLMLDSGPKGRMLRAIERGLMRRADLLVISSPAFVSAYFAPRQGLGRDLELATLLVENKVLELQPASVPPPPPPGPPWRISWLGAIRCRKSLAILTELAARRPDLLEVRIHGRPAYTEFDDFEGRIAAAPNVQFGGAYAASDLPRLYGEAHFAWAIDFMEAGLNSAWLLPNRLYEASRYGAAPIALRGVETGRYLERLGIGLPLEHPGQLEGVLDDLTAVHYAEMRRKLAMVPPETFVVGAEGCRRLVMRLARASEHSGGAAV